MFACVPDGVQRGVHEAREWGGDAGAGERGEIALLEGLRVVDQSLGGGNRVQQSVGVQS